MRSLLYRQSDTYAVHYGAAPLIQLSAEEAAEESEPVRQEPSREEDSPIENGTYVSQIPPMRVERVEEDQFGLDEVDRAELRRQEPEISRERVAYLSYAMQKAARLVGRPEAYARADCRHQHSLHRWVRRRREH